MLGETKFCCQTGPVPIVLCCMLWSASGPHGFFGNSCSLGSKFYNFSSSLDSLTPPVAWPDFLLFSYLSSNILMLFYSNSILIFWVGTQTSLFKQWVFCLPCGCMDPCTPCSHWSCWLLGFHLHWEQSLTHADSFKWSLKRQVQGALCLC